MGWSREIEDIHAKRKAALEQGGAEAVARQHAQGRLIEGDGSGFRASINDSIDALAEVPDVREDPPEEQNNPSRHHAERGKERPDIERRTCIHRSLRGEGSRSPPIR